MTFNKSTSRILIIVSTVLSFGLSAEMRNYEAPLDSANWQLDGNPLKCTLVQDIPHYGKAEFSSVANRRSNMNFALSLRNFKPLDMTQASLSSQPPVWKPNARPEPLGEVTMFPGEVCFQPLPMMLSLVMLIK